jgi:hypothetical protein
MKNKHAASFVLLAGLTQLPAQRARAEMLSAEVQSPRLAGFLHDIEALGYKVRFAVPSHTKSTQVCVPCLTTETGYTICADPAGPPEAPFCHQETETVSVQVIYEKVSDQPCTPP